MGIRPLVLSSFVLILLSVAPLSGQTTGRELSLAVGAMSFDASGTGTAPMAAIRAAASFGAPWLLGELSLGYASLDEQFSTSNTSIGVAEAQVQAQLPASRFRPYIGLGGGLLTYFNNAVGRSSPTPTLSAAVGARIPVSALVLHGEFRLRGWKSRPDSDGTNVGGELTAGVGYFF